MVKILFMIHDLSVGGAEKVLVNLINNMDRKKFDITLISLFGGGVNEQFLKSDIKYKTIFKRSFPGNSKIMQLFTPKQLHSFFVKENYDIEVSYLEGPCARIISGCSDKNTKLVSWIHVEQHTKTLASGSFRSYEESKKCYSKFDNTICVSEYVKKDFLSIYPMIKNIEVLYNTNETEEIIAKSKEIVAEECFDNTDTKIIGAGKIVPIKGFDKLAEVHTRLRKNGYQIHTYILGVGDERKKIEEYLEKEGMSDSFTFLGYHTNPYKYVCKSDIFVCASSAEGFSTAATEALIVGTPVVTTDVSGMKEMLGEDDEYGIVVNDVEDALYEGIKKLLDDRDLLEQYTEKAKERGKFFRKENTVKAVENMFLNL